MKAIFDHKFTEANNIVTLFFKPLRPINFIAGQYTQLTLPHRGADKRGIHRWFTISSPPGQELVSITTKFSGNGSTFKNTLANLLPGDQVNLAEPMGDFVLPKDGSIPLVFVAGGIGVTPFNSIFGWLVDNRQRRDIRLFYAVKNEGEMIFQDSFESANIHVTVLVSEPSADWGGERGRLSAEMILSIDEPPKNALFYLSGPEQMTKELQRDLLRNSINKYQIVTDFFPGYSEI